MAKKPYPGPADALERYEAAVAQLGDVDRKGAANPYTSLNGHMFSFLDKEGVVSVRLSDQDREAFLAAYDSGPSVQYGKTMRGYATVPDDLLSRTDELAGWLERSRTHIAKLEPKPTKRT